MFERRAFLTRLGAGVAAFTSAIALTPRAGAAEAFGGTADRAPDRAPDGPFTPARHAQDDWLDEVPGKHRFFFDSISPTGVGEAITFASNYYTANRGAYGLEASELAVVICLRHFATPFAFSDDVWSKYGKIFAERIGFMDPRSKEAPVINVYQGTNYGMLLSSRGTTIDAMIKRGTQFAICDMATHAFAGMVAAKVGASADQIYSELTATAIGNAHFVPAGIVAVNRAQERSYSIQYIG
ncbi:MAG: hypothetical protein ABI910_07510 [Gemmatimonadota bacterium]